MAAPAEALCEAGWIVPRVGQDNRPLTAALLERGQHQVELALGAAAVRRSVRSRNRRTQWRAQPRPEDEYGHVDRPLVKEIIDPLLKRGRSRQRQFFPEHRLKRGPCVLSLQALDHAAGTIAFLGHVARAGDEDADGLHGA